MSTVFTRPDAVGRLLELLFTAGIPQERIKDLPRIHLHLQAAADLAKGHEPQLPLTAMFARAVPTKAKKPPSKASHVVKRTRAARMAQLSPKLSPLGLVPARTIALVLSLDPHDVLAAMQAHGIESPWQSGHCPSEAERWERLLSGWGRGRALAWFDSHPSVESAALRKRFAEFADSMTFATELEAPK